MANTIHIVLDNNDTKYVGHPYGKQVKDMTMGERISHIMGSGRKVVQVTPTLYETKGDKLVIKEATVITG